MIPTLVVDNFFKNPFKVLEISKNVYYESDPQGTYPGERSRLLHEVNFNFFNLFHQKIFALLYPNHHDKIRFNASTTFQRVSSKSFNNPSSNLTGWVHSDAPVIITAIVYLSNHNNCGTSFWEPKNYGHQIHTEKKEMFFKKQISNLDCEKYLEENNSLFDKTLTINSKFNRLLLFDSSIQHSAEHFFDKNCLDDRLTLISFINDFYCPNMGLKNSVLESLRLE